MQKPLSAAQDKAFRGPSLPLDAEASPLRPKLRLVEAPEAESEVDVDRRLRALVRSEARRRLALGRLAAAFQRKRGHERLGFVRLGDYTKERLGLSGREVWSLSSVATRLAGLPAIARAFEAGELSWSRARLLATVADSTSEDLWLAHRMIGAQVAVWQAAEAIAAEGLSAGTAGAGTAGEATVAPRPESAPGEPGESEDVCPPSDRPAGIVTKADDEVDPAADPDSLDAFELDERMREVVRALQGIDARMGLLLRRLVESRSHRSLGFDSFDRYVRERLGISGAKARALVAVARRAREIPSLADAYASGVLSWSRALSILPVVGGEHAQEWIRRATEVTVRRLGAEVEWAMETRERTGAAQPPAPPPAEASLALPDRQMCAREGDERADCQVTFCGPASVVALLNDAVDAFRKPEEHRWQGLERLLGHGLAEWRAQPSHPDPVFERGGWWCLCPPAARGAICTTITWSTARGAATTRRRTGFRSVRHTICAGFTRASCARPARPRPTSPGPLGLRSGNRPLMLLRGDHYLCGDHDGDAPAC